MWTYVYILVLCPIFCLFVKCYLVLYINYGYKVALQLVISPLKPETEDAIVKVCIMNYMLTTVVIRVYNLTQQRSKVSF